MITKRFNLVCEEYDDNSFVKRTTHEFECDNHIQNALNEMTNFLKGSGYDIEDKQLYLQKPFKINLEPRSQQTKTASITSQEILKGPWSVEEMYPGLDNPKF